MSVVITFTAVVWAVIAAAFAVGALFALWRIVKGPTIVDRMVASDTLLTIVICVLGAEMVLNEHTASLPLMVILAMTAFIASVAVARYVSRQQRVEAREDAPAPGGAVVAPLASGEVVSSVLEPHHRDRSPVSDEERPGTTDLDEPMTGEGR